MAEKKYLGIPRKQIPWEPVIDPEKCIGCAICLDICPNGVFKMNDQTNQAEVFDPENCVVLCDKCAGFCDQNAISFPNKTSTKVLVSELLKEIGDRKNIIK